MDQRLETALRGYCEKWHLKQPRLLATTFTSDVFKVKMNAEDAVLKILNPIGREDERAGAIALRCFNGNGAAKLLDADKGAHLLEFVDGPDLKSVVLKGQDQRATEVICDVIDRLHSFNGPVPSQLTSMERNFRSLFLKAKTEGSGSIYVSGARLAEKLIEEPQDSRVLHGDLHHANVIHSSKRGWLAIDPKHLFGERTYDLANSFYNPNGYPGNLDSEETIERRCSVYSRALKLPRMRILEYAFSYGCLSAAWSLEDGQSADGQSADGQSAEEALKVARSIGTLIGQVST